MAATKISTLSPVYIFSIRQRAGLQLLSNAMGYLAGFSTEADRDAGVLLWSARERILRRAECNRMPRLYREVLAVVWRNPKASAGAR